MARMSAVAVGGTPPQARRLWGPADWLSALRIPLAFAFPLWDDAAGRLLLVVLAGVSDVLDGPVARRVGPSRAGAVLDPVADKAFTVSAFVTIALEHAGKSIGALELAAVLLRDIAAIGGLLAVLLLRRRPVTVPARRSGKAATVCQFATLAAVLLGSDLARPLVLLTAAVSVVAVVDYGRQGLLRLREERSAPRS
jgi:phosphatidylglycerophosphate synthase